MAILRQDLQLVVQARHEERRLRFGAAKRHILNQPAPHTRKRATFPKTVSNQPNVALSPDLSAFLTPTKLPSDRVNYQTWSPLMVKPKEGG